jgi:hypothetical protein
MTTPAAGRQLFEQQGTSSEQINKTTYEDLAVATGEIVQKAAELTDRADTTSGEIHQIHAEAVERLLEVAGLNLEAEPLSALLEELTDRYGFSWATLARCVRVTPTAVRKWRRGDEAAQEKKQRVARVLAFSHLLEQIDPRLSDAGHWLEGLMTRSATLTRADLYRAGADVDLLRMARSVVRPGPDNVRPEDLLDHYVSDWRTRFANDDRFKVEWDEEQMPSIVVREDDG